MSAESKAKPPLFYDFLSPSLMLLQWKGNVEGTMELLSKALKVDPTCQYAYEIKGTIEVQRLVPLYHCGKAR